MNAHVGTTDISESASLPGSDDEGSALAAPHSHSRGFATRFLTSPSAVVASILLVLIVIISVLAPVLPLRDPNEVTLAAMNAKPGTAGFVLGGDGSGRDILSRLVFGGRQTLYGGLISIAVALALGTVGGLLAGFFRGLMDSVLTWVSDALQSLPSMIILIIVAAGSHSNFVVLMAVLGIFLAPSFYRIVRSSTLAVRDSLFVDAAFVSGLSIPRIIANHVLPAILPQLVVQIALTSGLAIGMQAGLQFLGIGDASTSSWGAMMNDAFTNLSINQWLLVPPAVALAATTACLVLIGSTVGALTNGRPSVSRGAVRRFRRSHSLRSQNAAEHSEAVRVAASEPSITTERTANEKTVLSIRGLHVTYVDSASATEVVHGVSIDVQKGEVMGVVGESGSGKSQIVFSTLGLLPANAVVDSAGILVHGQDVTEMRVKERRRLLGATIGYIPQEPMTNLDPSSTIGSQLLQPLTSSGMSRDEARTTISTILTTVRIEDPEKIMRMYPHEISGGMAQRILIAGAIARHPDILVADEPTTALDVTVQAEVLELLHDLITRMGMSLLIVTHNFGVVADLCDRVTVIRDGKVVESGNVRTIFDHPAQTYTRRLIDASLDDAPSRKERDEQDSDSVVKDSGPDGRADVRRDSEQEVA